MEQYLSLLKNSNLFQGINEAEIKAMLSCLSARVVHFKKNEFILRNGEQVHSIGMVLTGLALIEKEDFWGNCSIISEILPGIIFAESYACLSQIPVETSVIASTATDVMFFNISKVD